MNAKEYYARLQGYVSDIRKVTDFEPEVAIVLGSGLGNFADNIDVVCEIDYHDLKGFPVSTAPGHEGKFIFGMLGSKKVVCMKGRVHYYEGYDMTEVVLPMRLMHLLGADKAIITNAVGGINTSYHVGSFAVLKDVITSFVPSPLRGENIPELGERFSDMTHVYCQEYRDKVLEIGKEIGAEVHEGVFVQLSGPQYETPTEIKMLRTLGADCVGMSSAVEAIAANHMGMKICGISCITNMAAGILDVKLSGEEVIEVANRVSSQFEAIVKKLVESM